MKKADIKFLIYSLVGWRLLLFFFVFLGIMLFPLKNDFLGGEVVNYLKNPYFWSFLNFDGMHYLSIAYQGYRALEYFFFPLYPILIRLLASFFNHGFVETAVLGILVSNASFVIGSVGLWKLIRLDYKEGIAKWSLLALLLFPTSFYFGAYYTESMALALIVWSFYFARKRNWIISGVLGALATATRITALALIPAILYEIWVYRKEKGKSLWIPVFSLLLIPLGLLAYMYYLYTVTGDPLEFFHSIAIFGAQRSTNLVLLPQVFYRYFFKVLPVIDYANFALVFTTYLEIFSAILFLGLGVLSYLKLRLSYFLYFAAGYLIPPLAGSFSSFPRYVLILFPAFIILGIWLEAKGKTVKLIILALLTVSLAIASALFVRGYWIS